MRACCEPTHARLAAPRRNGGDAMPMNEEHSLDEQSLTGAATLAFALLRFEKGAAHPSRAYEPPGTGSLGVDTFRFLPSGRRVGADEVPGFLMSFSTPVLLAPTTWGGTIALFLLDELSGARRKSAEHSFANWQNHLAHVAGQLGLTDWSSLILEFDDDEHVFSFSTLSLCMERYAVLVGWAVTPLLYDDPRAQARLDLIRSDGAHSWGGSCPLRDGKEDRHGQ